MRIALLTDGVTPFITGGMQQHSSSLAKNFVKEGFDLDLFHCVLSENDIISDKDINNIFFKDTGLSFNNVQCLVFPKSFYFPGHYLFNSYKYSVLIYDQLVKNINDYDFIYAKGFSAWKLIIEKQRLNFSVKIGVKFHGYEMYQFSPNFFTKLKHLMLRPFVKWNNLNADFVFSYGSKITSLIKMLGVSNEKIIEIPTGIDQSWFRNEITKNKHLKFLFIGRYEKRKGINELINVIHKLDFKNKKCEFHFVGPIPENKRVYFNSVKVFYHGLIKDQDLKKSIYDKCDVLICPSFSEGMPNVILEAMSRGLAILSSDVGAISLMVSYKNGLLIDKITFETLKFALEKFMRLSDVDLKIMKMESLKKANEFSWDNVINKLLSVINHNKMMK